MRAIKYCLLSVVINLFVVISSCLAGPPADDCWREATQLYLAYRNALAKDDGSTVVYYNVSAISGFLKKDAKVKSREERIERMAKYTAYIDQVQLTLQNPSAAYARCGVNTEGKRYTMAVFKTAKIDDKNALVFVDISILEGKITNIALATTDQEIREAEDNRIPFVDLPFRILNLNEPLR